jgi:FAD/FMN-containing dehydrogenase
MIDALNELLSPKRVRTDARRSSWGRDWTRSFSVRHRRRVSGERRRRRNAGARRQRRRWSLVPSGGRTGLSGGAVASNGEIVVSFDRMNRILDFNAADRIARCQAGVVTETLQDYAAERGLFYPVDFASSGSSQIGGNISTNAGGIRVIRHGLTRDWVAGLKVVTGTGAVLDLNRSREERDRLRPASSLHRLEGDARFRRRSADAAREVPPPR